MKNLFCTRTVLFVCSWYVVNSHMPIHANIRLGLADLEQMLQYLYKDNQDYHRMVYETIAYEKETPEILVEYLNQHTSLHKLSLLLKKKMHVKPHLKTLLLDYFVRDFYLDAWLQSIFEGDFATGYALYESVWDDEPLSDDVKDMLEFNEENVPLIRLFATKGLLKASYVAPFLVSAKKHLKASLRKNIEQIIKRNDLELSWQVYENICDDKVLPISVLHALKQEPEGNALLSLINHEGLVMPRIKEEVVTVLNSVLKETLGAAYAQRQETKRRNFAALINTSKPAAGSTSP